MRHIGAGKERNGANNTGITGWYVKHIFQCYTQESGVLHASI